MTIDTADQADLEAVRGLLTDAGLPVDGLMQVPTSLFVARVGDQVVGAVALERHGPDGLLRSLVVDPAQRGAGIGSALADAAEREAARQGLAGVYLLTETAEGFFAGRGYDTIPRDGAPPPVTASVEWSVACGDSAVPMLKEL